MGLEVEGPAKRAGFPRVAHAGARQPWKVVRRGVLVPLGLRLQYTGVRALLMCKYMTTWSTLLRVPDSTA